MPYVRAVRRDPGVLRVGVTTTNPIGDPPGPELQAAVRNMADCLSELGHEVREVDAGLPGPEALPLFLTVFAANIGLSIGYAQLLAGRAAEPGELEPLSHAMAGRAAATTSTEYLGAVAMLQAVSRRVIALWADIDVLLTPSLAQRPPAIGELSGEDEGAFDRAVAFAPYAGLFNATGQPAITVPAGVADDGLPVTVQLVGAPLAEDTLLQVATQVERLRPWAHLRPPA
jgi:amidase